MPILTRRRLGATMLAAVAAARTAPAAAASGGAPIAAIEADAGGRLGVFVRDTGSGRTLAHRADETFLLESTFKGPLAAMVLARVDGGLDRLDAEIAYSAADLVPASPVTAAHLASAHLASGQAASGRLAVAALVAAILERSDNTAANLLLRHVGGPGKLTAWLRAKGDAVTVINRYEIIAGQTGPMNTTSPRAIAGTAAGISLGDWLEPATRALNNRWMSRNSAAMQRLRGGLPPAWPGLDRTGTAASDRDDYAIVWPPGRPPLVIAAYYEKPDLADGAGEAVLRRVGAAVASWAA